MRDSNREQERNRRSFILMLTSDRRRGIEDRSTRYYSAISIPWDFVVQVLQAS
jgi:hypothetical protein